MLAIRASRRSLSGRPLVAGRGVGKFVDSYADHLIKIREVLRRLLNVRLRVNAAKFFALPEIEYLGYILTREGIKPQTEKCMAILALKRPKNIKSLRNFLGMVQLHVSFQEMSLEVKTKT